MVALHQSTYCLLTVTKYLLRSKKVIFTKSNETTCDKKEEILRPQKCSCGNRSRSLIYGYRRAPERKEIFTTPQH
jgi:hypothetical protein